MPSKNCQLGVVTETGGPKFQSQLGLKKLKQNKNKLTKERGYTVSTGGENNAGSTQWIMGEDKGMGYRVEDGEDEGWRYKWMIGEGDGGCPFCML